MHEHDVEIDAVELDAGKKEKRNFFPVLVPTSCRGSSYLTSLI